MSKISILKSRSIGDRFPAVFEYFFKEWKGLLTSYFLFVAPVLIFVLGYAGMLGSKYVKAMENMNMENPGDITEIFTNFGMTPSEMMLLFLLSILASVLSFSIIGSYITLRERMEDSPSSGDVLSHAKEKIMPVLVLLILSWILSMLGMIALCVGIFIVAVLISVAYPALFMENLSAVDALKRSADLVKKNFFDTFLFFLILLITMLFTSFILNLALAPISAIGTGLLSSNSMAAIIIMGVSAVLGHVVNILLYIGQFMHYGHMVEKIENNSLDSEIDAL